MKQRIRVVGLIKNEEGVLVFKRSRGRSDAPVFWELPTGKIKFGEQPEEAMVRSLTEYTGLNASQIKLKDVITFLAPEGSSQLSNLYIIYELGISNPVKPTPQDRYTAYKFVKDFTASSVRLNETSMSVLEIEEGKVTPGRISPRDTANSVIISVDGASRGNPGPSGIGYCIHDNNGKITERRGEFIGFATSRMAEYYAMRKGIERAIELGYKSVRFISDSLMVVNQLNGIFHIKNQDIIPVYKDIQKKIENFDAVSFTHVPRSKNMIADSEANAAIDETLRK
ncbi:reverse transcriptase-like protein [Candidatus Nanosyncoccus alces]|uniref:14.7 kDa ribonuclease H-like protein n=1 Tax=Candidatus Nanosyncoccus alces TaxID=2171997 RepID=A0ABY0FP45_9BACT|nr:reverse transcriptase-like protein [Candidatus Nanosyncoccus alces]RYC74714.1 14.7 kDa ribonuclease H-like protein [Candidatus Nanosyncoccus alces]